MMLRQRRSIDMIAAEYYYYECKSASGELGFPLRMRIRSGIKGGDGPAKCKSASGRIGRSGGGDRENGWPLTPPGSPQTHMPEQTTTTLVLVPAAISQLVRLLVPAARYQLVLGWYTYW